jgi:mRNA interferase RelE/StbE
MTYTVLLSPRADRDRRGLSDQIRLRIRDALLAFEDDPRPTGAAKLSGEHNRWRVRVGDYRILYEVDDAAQQVLVLRIAHRREVYR